MNPLPHQLADRPAPPPRWWIVLVLLGCGTALWCWATRADLGPSDAAWVVPLVACAWASGVQLLPRVLAFGQPTARRRTGRALAAAFIAAGYFLLTAWTDHRALFPKYHDEFVYLIQAHMLARGHLWMPAHQLADFFDNEYLFVQPVYATQPWPGYPLLLTMGLWLGVPPWVVSVIVSAGVVGLLCRITAELLGEPWDLLSALLLLAVAPFRHQSVSVGAFGASLLFCLLMWLSWLNWQRRPQWRWAVLFGVAAGWGAITRPADALCYAIPAAGAIIVSAARGVTLGGVRRLSLGIGCAILAALPFLTLQLIDNHGITGQWLQTPYLAYDRRDLPQVTFGFPRYNPALRPTSPLPQKQILYQGWAVPFIIAHQPGNALQDWLRHRIPTALSAIAPHPLLLVLLPVGLIVGCSRWRRQLMVPLASIPLFLLLYGCYTMFLPQYGMVIAPGMVLAILAGAAAVTSAFAHPAIRTVVPAVVAGLAIAVLPQLTHVREDPNPTPAAAAAHQLPTLIHTPAVVLFRYQPSNNVHDEPVYNADVAWPDDAAIIRAHDLGWRKDLELFRYYAKRQPQRQFYLLDEGDNRLYPLGNAAEAEAAARAAEQHEVQPPAHLPATSP